MRGLAPTIHVSYISLLGPFQPQVAQSQQRFKPELLHFTYRCVRNRGDFTCCKAKCALHQKHAALLAWQPTDSALQPFRGIACCKRKATTPACHHCQSHQSNRQLVVIELESSHEKSYERFPRCRFSLLKIAQIELTVPEYSRPPTFIELFEINLIANGHIHPQVPQDEGAKWRKARTQVLTLLVQIKELAAWRVIRGCEPTLR